MYSSLAKKIGFVFLMSGVCFSSFGQQIELDVKKDSTSNHANLMGIIAEVANKENHNFEGFLKVKVPEGFKSISGDLISLQLDRAEKQFIPLKIFQQQNVKAGTSHIEIILLNKEKEVLRTEAISQIVEKSNRMQLTSPNPMLYITNPNDSLTVRATVSNLGNSTQQVIVVFSVPGLVGEKNFFERRGVVEIQEDRTFTLKFLPPQALLDKSEFTINVAGMRGSSKELFGNLTITVQNISSTKRYQDMETVRQSNFFSRNSITGSYRRIGENTEVYQLMGSGDINLPAGYVSVSGNFYKANNSSLPIVSNTYLDYHLHNHHLKIGNISRPMEISLFGRGVEIGTTDQTKSKSIQVGLIDQNFNLIEKQGFFKNGYAFYASGDIGQSNSSNNYYQANYIFKQDAWEEVNHHLAGLEKAFVWGNDWRGHVKAYTGLSQYKNSDKDKTSMAFEARYNGKIKELRLIGNYFYSTPYYPGNRRGMLQLQQNTVLPISAKNSLYSNLFISDFAPKSLTYPAQMKSSNFQFDFGVNFTQIGNSSLKFGYHYQSESNNSFGGLLGSGATDKLEMKDHRLVEGFNWYSNNGQHSFSQTIEEGLSFLPDSKNPKFQFKSTTGYRYKWLNANISYQYGSFFLSEYITTQRQENTHSNYQRLMASVSANHQLFQNKMTVSAGSGYIKDFISGQTPSAFLNLQYLPSTNYRVYLNSSWYRYDRKHSAYSSFSPLSNMFIIEAGLTVNIKGRKSSSAQKGKITALVYYDKNGNNLYDEGDEVAADYLITLDNTTFKTDKNGSLAYRSLPFGEYTLKSTMEKGWFTKAETYILNKHHIRIEIPLHQSGTVSGKIRYSFNARTAVDFQPRIRGIVFNIYKKDKLVKKISTDDDGKFLLFLPKGDYQIVLNENSLPANTYVEHNISSIAIEPGKIVKISTVLLKVKEKKINIKRFGE